MSTERDIRNRQFLKDHPTSYLAQWLRTSATIDNFEPMWFSPEPSYALQFRHYFEELSEKDQRRIRKAVAIGIRSWHPTENGYKALDEMLNIAAVTRAKQAATPLIKFVDQQLRGEGDAQQEHALCHTIGLLAAWTPNKGIEAALLRWFYDPTFPPRPVAMMLNGLVHGSNPQGYPHLVERFLEVKGQHPKLFQTDAVFRELARLAGAQTVAEHLHELVEPSRSRFLEGLRDSLSVEVIKDPFGIRDRKTGEMFPAKIQQ